MTTTPAKPDSRQPGKRFPVRVEATRWPLVVPGGSYWLMDHDAPTPRNTFRRFQTADALWDWLNTNGYRLTRRETREWSGEWLLLERTP